MATVAQTHESLHVEQLSEGIVWYRFTRSAGWREFYPPNSPIRAVLELMKDNGAYSVVQVANARTSLVGPAEGVATPLQILVDQRGGFVAVNGGFFVHLTKLFRSPDTGHLLPDDMVTFTVGPSSATTKSIQIPRAYEDLLLRRDMSDGSYFYTGPSLVQELAITDASFDKLNTRAGRFNYFALDAEGQTIKSPVFHTLKDWDTQYKAFERDLSAASGTSLRRDVEEEYLTTAMKRKTTLPGGDIIYASKPPANENIKTIHASVPGNLSHVTQANERSGVSRHPGAELYHAYTSQRSDGLTMNEFGKVVKAAIAFLEHTVVGDNDIWANDGGPSVFQIFVGSDMSVRLLARGGLETQSLHLVLDPQSMRSVPNAIVARAQGLPRDV